ncbi:MAG: lipopolysaccharide biosynthesis protein [Candidatus Sumerlaeia bacterium]
MAARSVASRLVFINTIANVLGQIWTKFLAFLIIPWLVHYLDEERFGIYALGVSLLVLGTLFDPGMKYGYIKIFSEFLAKGRTGDLRRLMGASLGAYLAISALMLGVAWVFIEPVMAFLGVPEALFPQAAFFFICILIHLALAESFAVFRHAMLAMQRMVWANKLNAVSACMHYAFLAMAIVFDWGLPGMGLVFVGAAVFQSLLFTAAWLQLQGQLGHDGPRTPIASLFWYLLRFSWGLKVAANCQTTIFHLDKIFISRFVSLAAAGTYQIGSTLAVVVREFMRLGVSALLPAIADMAARDDRIGLRRVHRQATRLFVCLCAPGFFYVAAMAPIIIQAWLGSPDSQSALALSLLSLAFFANVILAPSMETAAALHLSRLHMWTALFAAICNIILNYFFVQKFGFMGPPLASILSLSVASIIFLARVLHRLDDGFGAFLTNALLRPIIMAGAPAMALGWMCRYDLMARLEGAGSIMSLLTLCVAGIIYAVVSLGLILLSGHLKKPDLDRLRQMLGRE